MTSVEVTPASQTEGQAPRERRCVLMVHGVGEQKKSGTLLYIGSPLVQWVLQWSKTFSSTSPARVGEVALSFVPYDVGAADTPPVAILELPDQTWYLAEAWWAGSNAHPDLGTMLQWSLAHLGDILAQMIRNTIQRARKLVPDQADATQPNRFWQLVDLVNCVGLAVAYGLAAVIGYPVLVLLMLLAQIPVESLQNFVLLKLIRPVLVSGAGEFRMYLDDELQAANVRHRVAQSARQLMAYARCDELIVVAHSEGAVVSYGMLTDDTYPDVRRRVRKFMTFGAGLNKTWLLNHKLDRLYAELSGNVLWTDFWASYDPVPAGPLDPGKGHSLASMYRPTHEVLAQTANRGAPVSLQVTNGMNVLTDHGGYFTNDEQVLVRLAAEIAAPDHTTSAFWPAEDVLARFVRGRRERVCALALGRDVAVVVATYAAIAPWLLGWMSWAQAWEPISKIPSQAGLAGFLVGSLRSAEVIFQPIVPPISSLVGTLLGVPALVGSALLVALAVWCLYRLLQWRLWERWDKHARLAFVKACAESGRAKFASQRL